VKQIIIVLALSAIGALVQAIPAPPQKPPTIPDTIKAQFFKSQAQFMQAQAAAQEKQGAFTKVIDMMRKMCGDSFALNMDKDGDPVCEAKAEKSKPVPADAKKP
jgi:hypothetical protein